MQLFLNWPCWKGIPQLYLTFISKT